jgi:L-ascorbate metabolism protein UlaG (beta-lactamase superfamily)
MAVLIFRIIPLLVLSITLGSVSAQVKLEYVAHACFVIESPQGVRILIDPYNTNRWLGYQFPEEMKADAVLVTHPHYDHDANYHVSFQIPVFREPGTFSIGDVKLRGLIGKHADPYGKDFKQINTIWVVETGGKRFVHLGDNGPLTEQLVKDLGTVDVLMVPIDSTYHILKQAEIEAILAAVKPRTLVPMHYQIPELSRMEDLGPIDPWLEGRSNTTRLSGNRYQLEETLAGSTQILVFSHSPEVKPWVVELRQAWGKAREGLKLLASTPSEAAMRFTEATQIAPQVIAFWSGLAAAMEAQGQKVQALGTLQRGLIMSQPDDWEHTLGARVRLAGLYATVGKNFEARQQARIVLRNSYRPTLIEQAQRVYVSAR